MSDDSPLVQLGGLGPIGPPPTFEIDPVCKMRVLPATAAAHFDYEGKTYYFCAVRCMERFKADPQAFAGAKPKPQPEVSNAMYTCPMHPEVRKRGFGTCPKCGMALEPEVAQADEGVNPELADMSRRFWLAAAASIPVMALAMMEMQPIVQFILATPVVLWAGWPLLERGAASVKHRSLNMFTLIGMGVGTAYVYSVVALFTGAGLPVYFEAASVITALVLLGQVLELRARARTSSAIKSLLGLAPKTARRVDADGRESDVPLEHVHVGNTLRVRPGEKVPVDGTIVEGASAIDESMISGESIPVEKVTGAKVTGGTINGTGSFLMRAERVGGETLLAQIVQMVGQAQRSRAPIQRTADVVSAWFVPAVIAAAVITFGAWMMFSASLSAALLNSVAVLIIACPCALGLATPMSIMVGVGRGATLGVLIRNAEALEVMEKVDTVVIDKTGTLTEGKPVVVAVVPLTSMDEEFVLGLAASVEKGSEHPLASAIVRAAEVRGLAVKPVSGFVATPGKGVRGTREGRQVALGNLKLAEELGIDGAGAARRAEGMRSEGQTVMFVVIDREVVGLIGVSDPIKPSTGEAIAGLHAEGIRVIVLTGDSRTTAEAVARKLQLDDVRAEVLPDQKAAVVRELQSQGRIVAMAGDGVNDAPALAQAHVGIAMGTGTDVAMESAGITLLSGDLRGILRARALSVATMKNIRQNLFLAFVYNTLGVPIAAGALYPLFGWTLSPMIASAAMTFSSLSVIGNALRLRRVSLQNSD